MLVPEFTELFLLVLSVLLVESFVVCDVPSLVFCEVLWLVPLFVPMLVEVD